MKPLLLSIAILFATRNGNAEEFSKPLAVHSGHDSKITTPQYKLLTSDKEWQNIWASHLGTRADDYYRQAFEVDFEKCMVIAILRGNRINVRGIKINNVINKSDVIVIRFNDVGYQTASSANEVDTSPPDKPFAFVIIPKAVKDIALEDDTQIYKNEPPVWKEIARLRQPR